MNKPMPETTPSQPIEPVEKHNAIEKALIILKLYNPTNQELGTVEISKILGYHKATVSRTLLLLAKYGFLEQNPDNKKFKLGPAILSLGMVLSRSLKADLVHIAKPYMDALRDRFQESVVLEVLSTKHVVIAFISEGPKRIRLAGEIGDILPVYVTAGAKSILAFSSPEVRNRLMDQEFKKLTPNTIIDPDLLMKQFEEIRKKGYGTDIGEHDLDINAIAAPVLNIEERPVASIVMAGFSNNIDTNENSEMVKAVKETALTISKQLYYSYKKSPGK
jgi:IclR family transcriptional regulator, KDG regulon repressor